MTQPFERKPIVQFFKPTSEELIEITRLAVEMRAMLIDGGFIPSMADQMIVMWWASIMQPSLEEIE